MLMRLLIILLGLGMLAGCASPTPGPLPADYFVKQDSGEQTGNIKLVEIATPKGKFHVWTKRFGYNPKIKVLLLHG